MIGKRRRERRRQARAAIERYEYQHANDTARVEALELRADAAETRSDELRLLANGLEQRLDDANRELARWGLEPVTRDLPESAEHPQRYRRHTDWRTSRSGEELQALLERSGLDAWEPEPRPDQPVATGRGYLTFEEFGAPAERGEFVRTAVDRVLAEREPMSNADLVAEIRGALHNARDALSGGPLSRSAAMLSVTHALERMDPADPMCIVSGEVHLGLALQMGETSAECTRLAMELDHAKVARDTAITERDAARRIAAQPTRAAELEARIRELEAQVATLEHTDSGDGAIADLTRELDDATTALAEQRVLTEQAERSRDRSVGRMLDLERWREKERDVLAAFVRALAPAVDQGSLHERLREPYDRAAAILEDPEA